MHFFWPNTHSNTVTQVNIPHWTRKLHLCVFYAPEVISGHETSPTVFDYNLRQKHARALKTPWMCSAQQYLSNDMQHDLFVTLTRGQIFKLIFSGQLIPSSFHPSRRGKRDAGKISVIQVSSQKLWYKNLFRKNANLEAKPLTLGKIWEHYSERPLKELSNALSSSSSTAALPIWFLTYAPVCEKLSKLGVKVNKILLLVTYKDLSDGLIKNDIGT